MADDPTQPNPYIRTYAQDVAALSGKEPVPPPAKPVAPPADADRQAVLDRLRSRSQKPAEQVHETVVIPPTMPQITGKLPEDKASGPEPVLPIPVPLPPPVVPVQMPTPPVFTAPPAPLVSPIITPPVAPAPPVFAPAPNPFPPPAPLPRPAPEAPAIVKVPVGPMLRPEQNLSPIHTYKTDFSDKVDTDKASAFSVLAAQADSGQTSTSARGGPKNGQRNIIFVIVGVMLLLVAGVGAYVAYTYVNSHKVVSLAPTVPSLVFADDRQKVSGEGAILMQALADSAGSALGDGQVRILYLTESSTTQQKSIIEQPLPGGVLFGALQLPAPDILLRNIGPETTVGIVHAGDETRPFFILRVLSYESTFAGMLTWERTMQNDLSLLYPLYPAPVAPTPVVIVATTTATTTTATSTTKSKAKAKPVATTTPVVIPPPAPIIVAPHFVDEVASNHDVRALKDGNNRTILLYGYRDKETLIIARDEASFAELVNRLAATRTQ